MYSNTNMHVMLVFEHARECYVSVGNMQVPNETVGVICVSDVACTFVIPLPIYKACFSLS